MNTYPPRSIDPSLVGKIMIEYAALRMQGYVPSCILYVLASKEVTIAELVREDGLFADYDGRNGYRLTIQKSALTQLLLKLCEVDDGYEGRNTVCRWVMHYEEHGVDLVADIVRTGKKSLFLMHEGS